MASWAKAPFAIGAVACAACLAIAGTMTSSVPAVQRAADQLERAAQLRLAAISDVDAFSALGLTSLTDYGLFDGTPALAALLQGNPDKLLADNTNAGYAALSAIDVFFGDGANGAGGVFTGGGVDALANYDALSAIPVFVGTNGVFTGGGIGALAGYDALSALPVFQAAATAAAAGDAKGVATALGGYAALSAANTFFGQGSLEADGTTYTGGVFTGGGINALAPGSDGNGGYAALSALPVFAGTDPNAPFGLGVFTGGGVGALTNYDALSAVPAYLNATQGTTPLATPLVAKAAPAETTFKTQAVEQPVVQKQDVDTSLGAKPLVAVAPPTDPAPADPAPADSTPPASSSKNPNNKAGQSYAGVFKPGGTGSVLPIFGGGGAADNGISGWGDMLKKAGLNGGESAGAAGGGASAGGGTDGAK
jgi:hypothetical protein